MKVLTQEQYDKMIEILTQHKGKASAITAEQIAEQIGLVETDATNPSLRYAIKNCINELELPIGSSYYGYYMIDTLDELLECYDSLLMRAGKIIDRARKIRMAYMGVAKQAQSKADQRAVDKASMGYVQEHDALKTDSGALEDGGDGDV